MEITRRNFIRNSTIVASGIAFFPSSLAGVNSRDRRFGMEIGVCTDFTKSDLLKRFGCSYVEEGVQKFLVPFRSDEESLKNLELARETVFPIKVCNSFLPSELKCVGPKADHQIILKYAETAFRRAKMAGVKIVVFGSGGARQIPEGFSKEEAMNQFLALCKQMSPIAGRSDVKLVLEPLNSQECNFINSVAEGGEVVKEVDHPNFLLLADIYHMKKDNESSENIVNYGRFLHHVHIAEKEGRSAPGKNNENFAEYFKALKKAKYKGAISIECNWQNMEEQLPMAIRTIHSQMGN